MENLKKLEVNKLIKELEFVNSDFLYRSELLDEADLVFMKSVDEFLKKNPELKETFEEILSERESKQFDLETNESQVIEEKVCCDVNFREPKLRNLYRIIAKSTHPDKIGDNTIKELYLDATDAYEKNDLLTLFSICDKLKIPYDVSDEELNLLREEIEKTKNRLKFLETTYTWKWITQEDNKEKIIFDYIKSQIKII